MSRRNRIPAYRLHKQSGQAVVTLSDGLGGRRDVLLGKFDTAGSRLEYARVVAEWETSGRCVPSEMVGIPSVKEAILSYYEYAEELLPEERQTHEPAGTGPPLFEIR